MTLMLKDIVFKVRSEIGELSQYQWSDEQIIFDVNHYCREMCSNANFLTKFQNVALISSTGGLQEAALDSELDLVKECKYFNGQLFPLEPRTWEEVQTGAAVGSIPLYFYTKTGTRDLTPQSMATSDIQDIPIGPNTPYGEVYRTVIGCWPIPPSPAYLHVWYSYLHDWMMDPTAPCAVPDQFLEGLAAGVIARCMRIKRGQAEASKYEGQFKATKEEFRMWAGRRQNSKRPARYGQPTDPWRTSASSSIIVVDQNPGGI